MLHHGIPTTIYLWFLSIDILIYDYHEYIVSWIIYVSHNLIVISVLPPLHTSGHVAEFFKPLGATLGASKS